MIRTLKSLVAIALAASALSAAPAFAHAPKDPDAVGKIDKLGRAAALAFRGRVTKIDYRQSAGKNGAPGMPYTFVTYAIDKVLQGKTAGKTVTLRFIGGPDGRGGFVDVEGVPTFQQGDDDILFVAGNGAANCPLVQCEFGRFRVKGNAVYEAHGSPVRAVAEGKIVAHGKGAANFEEFTYPAPSFDDLIKRPEVVAAIRKAGLTVAQARARYNAEAPKSIRTRVFDPLLLPAAAGRAKADDAPVSGLGVDAFMAEVGSALSRLPQRAASTVVSANPDAPIAALTVRDGRPIAAPAVKVDPGKTIVKN